MTAAIPSGSGHDEPIRKLIHDLRTPATVISGFADLLERGGEELSPERRAEYISRIAEAGRELRTILDHQRPDSTS
jgi:signal transduction histidine kinase